MNSYTYNRTLGYNAETGAAITYTTTDSFGYGYVSAKGATSGATYDYSYYGYSLEDAELSIVPTVKDDIYLTITNSLGSGEKLAFRVYCYDEFADATLIKVPPYTTTNLDVSTNEYTKVTLKGETLGSATKYYMIPTTAGKKYAINLVYNNNQSSRVYYDSEGNDVTFTNVPSGLAYSASIEVYSDNETSSALALSTVPNSQDYTEQVFLTNSSSTDGNYSVMTYIAISSRYDGDVYFRVREYDEVADYALDGLTVGDAAKRTVNTDNGYVILGGVSSSNYYQTLKVATEANTEYALNFVTSGNKNSVVAKDEFGNYASFSFDTSAYSYWNSGYVVVYNEEGSEIGMYSKGSTTALSGSARSDAEMTFTATGTTNYVRVYGNDYSTSYRKLAVALRPASVTWKVADVANTVAVSTSTTLDVRDPSFTKVPGIAGSETIYYAVILDNTKKYTFYWVDDGLSSEVSYTNKGTYPFTDCVLNMYDASKIVISFNAPGSTTINNPTSGTYYIGVKNWNSNTTSGTCAFRVTDVTE